MLQVSYYKACVGGGDKSCWDRAGTSLQCSIWGMCGWRALLPNSLTSLQGLWGPSTADWPVLLLLCLAFCFGLSRVQQGCFPASGADKKGESWAVSSLVGMAPSVVVSSAAVCTFDWPGTVGAAQGLELLDLVYFLQRMRNTNKTVARGVFLLLLQEMQLVELSAV